MYDPSHKKLFSCSYHSHNGFHQNTEKYFINSILHMFFNRKFWLSFWKFWLSFFTLFLSMFTFRPFLFSIWQFYCRLKIDTPNCQFERPACDVTFFTRILKKKMTLHTQRKNNASFQDMVVMRCFYIYSLGWAEPDLTCPGP